MLEIHRQIEQTTILCIRPREKKQIIHEISVAITTNTPAFVHSSWSITILIISGSLRLPCGQNQEELVPSLQVHFTWNYFCEQVFLVQLVLSVYCLVVLCRFLLLLSAICISAVLHSPGLSVSIHQIIPSCYILHQKILSVSVYCQRSCLAYHCSSCQCLYCKSMLLNELTEDL